MEIKAAPYIERLLDQLHNDGRTDGTIISYRKAFKHLLKDGCDLFNPENTKATLADDVKLKPRTKKNYAAILNVWFGFVGITWKRPRYNEETEIPNIPSEILLDQFIAALGRIMGAYCQLQKETGARCGEISNLTWASIDFQQRIVRIKPEKGSNPRILPLTEKAIGMLNNVKAIKNRTDGHIFASADSMRSSFHLQRKHVAKKLHCPEMLQIHFHTFRHWKATMEQHKTHDPWHVKTILGHKSIKSTENYIHIEKMRYRDGINDAFHVKVATSTEEISALLET